MDAILRAEALWVFAGVLVSQFFTWLLGRRNAANDATKAAGEERSVAFQSLLTVEATLREDMNSLRQDLAAEQKARELAESRVRLLRDEVHNLRNMLQARGVALPPPLPAE